MKRKDLRKLIIVVSLVATLAIAVPFMSGCLGKPAAAPPAAPPEVPPEVAPPEVAPPEEKVITAKIGFLAPLTGPVSGWGLPGLYGDEIWVEHFNAEGGLVLSDGTRVLVELVPYDDEYLIEKAVTGGRKLVLEDEVVLVQMLGGPDAVAVVPWFTERFMISTTLLPSDLTPTTLYHLAPVELHPMHNVSSMTWLAENRPELKTMAITGQDDDLGRGSMAVKVAVAEAYGIDVIYAEFFDPETIDFAPIVSDMIASGADILSWGASYPDYVKLLTIQAFEQGFEGQMESCVFDFYEDIIDSTSVEFMEGTVWGFPDFDDPMLNPSPNPYTTVQPIVFWDEYQEKYPGTWTAVSWEYQAQLDGWVQAVLYADSIDPMDVFRAWKTMPNVYHPYGEGTWWGRPFWGIDNAFMSDWPCVQMQNGKGRIVEFYNLLDWWGENKAVMLEVNERYDMMWYQRMGIPKETAIEMYGLEEEYK